MNSKLRLKKETFRNLQSTGIPMLLTPEMAKIDGGATWWKELIKDTLINELWDAAKKASPAVWESMQNCPTFVGTCINCPTDPVKIGRGSVVQYHGVPK